MDNITGNVIDQVYDVDYLTPEEKQKYLKELENLEMLKTGHYCLWVKEGFCQVCEGIYLAIHDLQTELRNRS